MPRYFFHTADGSRDRDTEGTELANSQAARVEAIKFAGSLMAQNPDVLWDGKGFRVEVTDHQQQMLFTIVMLVVDARRP